MLLYLKVHRAKPQRDEPCSAGCAHYRIHRKEYQTYTLVELWVLFGSCIYRSKLCEFERSVALEQNAIQPVEMRSAICGVETEVRLIR